MEKPSILKYTAEKGITNLPEKDKTGIDFVVKDNQGWQINFSGFNLMKDGVLIKSVTRAESSALTRICNDLIKIINEAQEQIRTEDRTTAT